jgi:hypothetical protein
VEEVEQDLVMEVHQVIMEVLVEEEAEKIMHQQIQVDLEIPQAHHQAKEIMVVMVPLMLLLTLEVVEVEQVQ